MNMHAGFRGLVVGGLLLGALTGTDEADAAPVFVEAPCEIPIVNGAVRDADELDACRFGVRALQLVPRRSDKRGLGESGVVVAFAGVMIRPGDWIYADRDGWLVSVGGPLPA